MNRLPALALVALLPAVSCAPGASDPADAGPVVARVAGEPIHQGELDEWLREDLFEQATEGKEPGKLFEFRSEGLDRMIAARLLESESERRGVEIAQIHASTVGGVTVSEADVEAFYADNRERLVDATFEEMAPRIRGYLEQQRQGEAWNAFVRGLHEQAGVETLMEAPRLEVAAIGPALGPADAPVTIVEFSDFNCPYCQQVTPTLKTIRLRYPDQVRIVFRHFPLEMHPRARPIAEASVCADEQGAFWAFHDAVFEKPEPMADTAIRELAGRVGLDLAVFDACLVTGRAGQVVDRDVADGAAVGVTGTPAFFVNGIRLSGAQPMEAFARAIDEELADASAAGEPAPSS